MIIRKYDVFVSFRGEDTRKGFTDHLCAALQRKSIITFRDDKNLKKGEVIAPELLQAIEGSQVFIVVFSKNYASSTWGLRELAKIVDCVKVSGGKHVLPIFYDVDPSEVRKQSGNFEKAFFQHEERFKDDLEMVQRSKEALTQVANLSGWDIRNKKDEIYVKEVLNFRGFFPDISIRVLIDKSLITRKRGFISMHDLLKELGRSIVREKSPKEPRKWSRLWNYKDLDSVMQDNMVAENLEAIVLPQYPVKIPEETVRANALSQMSHLKLLVLWNVNFSGCLDYLSSELGYLHWDKYPFTCLPSSFQPDNLVELILCQSSIKYLWKGTKSLLNLRHMDLSHSKNLIKMPNFREIPNLERLNLKGCIKLVRIDPSIGLLRKLAFLNLKNCKNLVIPNDIMGLSCLEVLNISGC